MKVDQFVVDLSNSAVSGSCVLSILHIIRKQGWITDGDVSN